MQLFKLIGQVTVDFQCDNRSVETEMKYTGRKQLLKLGTDSSTHLVRSAAQQRFVIVIQCSNEKCSVSLKRKNFYTMFLFS